MTQTLVLMKGAGAADQLHRLQADGVLRVSAGTLGGCYSAFGLAEGPMTARMTTTLAAEGCNPPYDMDCTFAELMAWLQKVSGSRVLANVAFALLAVDYGRLSALEERLRGMGLDELPNAYVAAGYVSGCGPHNVLVEVMADSHDRMIELLRMMTEHDGVLAVNVIRVDPEQTRGFGTEAVSSPLR